MKCTYRNLKKKKNCVTINECQVSFYFLLLRDLIRPSSTLWRSNSKHKKRKSDIVYLLLSYLKNCGSLDSYKLVVLKKLIYGSMLTMKLRKLKKPKFVVEGF